MRLKGGLPALLMGLVLVGCGTAPVTADPAPTAGAALSALALGPAGALDTAYGQGGVAGLPAYRARLVRALVQSDGQVLMMGQSARGGRVSSHLERLTAGGQPDTAFNDADTSYFPETDAVPALLCPRGANRYHDWGAECQDPQRIVVAGSSRDTGALTLWRLLPSGRLDPTFGTGGRVASPLAVGDVQALLIQSDGRLVVLGTNGLARFSRGGEVDLTFGVNGLAPLTLPPGAAVQDLVMDPAERFLILSNTVPASTDAGTATTTQVSRLTRTGQPDPSYGTAGTTQLDFGPGGEGRALLVLNTGRLVVGGTGGLWRLLPGGAPDATFGTAGHATFPAGDDFIISGLVQDTQNRLVASVLTAERFRPTFAGNLARLRNDGTLDPGFGAGGVSHVALCAQCTQTGGLAEFDAVAVLKSGRLLGLGTSGRGNTLLAARMFP